MGGRGSGLSTRFDKKKTIEETKRIDIRFMKKRGFLKPSVQGTLMWSSGGQPRGNINFSCRKDYLKLDFNYRYNREGWQPVEQKIWFDRTPCNYGGERLWFKCPSCTRRVAVLCSGGKLFLCRHCYDLPYSSKQEGYLDRLSSKKHKLGQRLFEHYEYGNGWGKKKGMHQKTFDRLFEEYIILEQQWDRMFEKYIHCVP